MPRSCAVCSHPERAAIDEALAGGAPLAAIAAKHRVSADSVSRHRAKHLPAAIVAAHASAEVTRGDGLLAKVGELSARAESMYRQAEAILRRARRRRDHDTALEAIRTAAATLREGRGTLDLLVKVYAIGVDGAVRARVERELEAALDRLRGILPTALYVEALNVLASGEPHEGAETP